MNSKMKCNTTIAHACGPYKVNKANISLMLAQSYRLLYELNVGSYGKANLVCKQINVVF